MVFSNYHNSRYSDHNLRAKVKIWEAARATSAAPSFFGPIKIEGRKFGDGALNANNPVRQVWWEAKDLFRDRSDSN